MGQIPYNRLASDGDGFDGAGCALVLLVVLVVLLAILLLGGNFGGGAVRTGPAPAFGAAPVTAVSPAPPAIGTGGMSEAPETSGSSGSTESSEAPEASEAQVPHGPEALPEDQPAPPVSGLAATAPEVHRPRHVRRRHRRASAQPLLAHAPGRCGLGPEGGDRMPDPGWEDTDTDSAPPAVPDWGSRRRVLVIVGGDPDGPARRVLVGPPGPGYLAPPAPVPYGFPDAGGTGCGGD